MDSVFNDTKSYRSGISGMSRQSILSNDIQIYNEIITILSDHTTTAREKFLPPISPVFQGNRSYLRSYR